jgi:hypothetical protein
MRRIIIIIDPNPDQPSFGELLGALLLFLLLLYVFSGG